MYISQSKGSTGWQSCIHSTTFHNIPQHFTQPHCVLSLYNSCTHAHYNLCTLSAKIYFYQYTLVFEVSVIKKASFLFLSSSHEELATAYCHTLYSLPYRIVGWSTVVDNYVIKDYNCMCLEFQHQRNYNFVWLLAVHAWVFIMNLFVHIICVHYLACVSLHALVPSCWKWSYWVEW